VIILPSEQVQSELDALWKHPFGRNTALIGSISEKINPRVLLKTLIGGTRILDMLSGEMLPRIC
jgi:hydrogenase expression/formation protein HypE